MCIPGLSSERRAVLLRRLSLGFAISAFGNVIIGVAGQALSYLVQAYAANLLGDEDYGRYTVVFAWLDVLMVSAVIGFDRSVVRFVAIARGQDRWSEVYGALRVARRSVLVAGAVTTVVLVVAALLVPMDNGLANTFLIGALVLPAWAVFRVNSGALGGLKRVAHGRFLVSIARPATWFGVLWVATSVLELDRTGAMAMSAHVVTIALMVAVSWFVVARSVPRSDRCVEPDVSRSREWRRISAQFTVSSASRVLVNRADILIVGMAFGAAEAGVYAVASRLAQLLAFGLSASNSVVSPLVAEHAAAGNRREVQRAVYQSSLISTASAIVIGFVTLLASDFLLGIFGERFVDGRPIFVVLAVGQVVNALAGPVGIALNMGGHERTNSRILMVSLLIYAAAAVPAIIWFDVIGMAVVTAAIRVLRSLWMWWEVRRRMGVNSSVFVMGSKL